MPLWAAVAIVAAAYVLRSIMRGFDFSPDLPIDAILLGAFAVLLAIVGVARSLTAADHPDDAVDDKVDNEDDDSGKTRQKQDVLDEIE
jgi:hypothetical protein